MELIIDAMKKNFHWKEAAKELFTNKQYIQAVERFLSFGEETYSPRNEENYKRSWWVF